MKLNDFLHIEPVSLEDDLEENKGVAAALSLITAAGLVTMAKNMDQDFQSRTTTGGSANVQLQPGVPDILRSTDPAPPVKVTRGKQLIGNPRDMQRMLSALQNPNAGRLLKLANAQGMRGLELLQFIAQCAHESQYFTKMKEDGTSFSFRKYDIRYNPANAKLLGNIHAGDGARYAGRGLIQLTGRDNYRQAGAALGLPLEEHPELAERPDISAQVALWYWNAHVRKNVTNFDDTAQVTRHINKHLNGFESRLAKFNALKVLVSQSRQEPVRESKKKVNEGINSTEFKKILKVFLPIAKKIIKLDKLPTIVLKKHLTDGMQPTQGRFCSETYTLEIAIAGRQPVDVLRTLAHELVHARQTREHVEIDSATGSAEENEANTIAGVVMRHFNKLYPQYLTVEPITEMGGNVRIGQHDADRIDLNKVSREQIVPLIDHTLQEINKAYEDKYKEPLWSESLLQSKDFLSGSSSHFFSDRISHTEFVRVKPTVGDIDTKVDVKQKNNIESFLNSVSGKRIGFATFVGYKTSAGQFITLWEFNDPAIKIQIDLELVEYENGEPTEWSHFSHSSSWDDLQAGIKGVFHKYLLRAFTTKGLRDRYIEMKSGGLKKVTSTDLAFSVTNGMREKYKPVADILGKQIVVDGLPVYKEIPTTQSKYINSITGMFEMIFGQTPTSDERIQFGSFVGCLKLANRYLDNAAKEKLINGFVLTLFGPAAQQLYKNDPGVDRTEKDVALNTMIKVLKMEQFYQSIKASVDQNKNEFYSKYKTLEPISENTVAASPRQGIQHLQKMNDLEFINFVKKLKHEMHGKLGPIKMTLKVDGLGARFGKDRDGNPFFESSSSGPIFSSGSFTGYAIKQGFTGERLQRAAHYDDIYELIVNSTFIQQLPNDTKVNCEVLYNPMAEESERGFKFVTVEYDKSKLGKVMTIVPFDSEVASSGGPHPRSEHIKDFLIKIGGEGGIKFVDDRLKYIEDIDINAEIDPILSMIDAAMIAKLSSRLKVDAAEKQQIKAFLQAAKDSISELILNHPSIIGKEQLGKNIEGVIIHRQKESPIKITTPGFKKAIAAKRVSESVEEPIDVAFAFGRFNPPHKGHVQVWNLAAKSGKDWFICTNPQTHGAKDPLPFEVKSAWMEAIDPQINGHILPENNILSAATAIYNKFDKNDNLTIAYVTDEQDWNWSGQLLTDYNDHQAAHGYYKFAKIIHITSPRISAATDLRLAASEHNEVKFYQIAGVDPLLEVNGDRYYETVVKYSKKTTKKESKSKMRINDLLSEKMLPKSAFAGTGAPWNHKLGGAGQLKGSTKRPAKAGDLVGGAAESIDWHAGRSLEGIARDIVSYIGDNPSDSAIVDAVEGEAEASHLDQQKTAQLFDMVYNLLRPNMQESEPQLVNIGENWENRMAGLIGLLEDK